jgi:hypothetical protein
VGTYTRLDIGRAFDGTSCLNGWARRIVYHPRRLPDVQLQGLTA